MQNMTNDILNEEFEVWMCGHDDRHKGPCPPEGCQRGQCVREQARLMGSPASEAALTTHQNGMDEIALGAARRIRVLLPNLGHDTQLTAQIQVIVFEAMRAAAPINPVCDLQTLLEIRDFLQDIVGGAEISERSRDVATGFVSIMDNQFGAAWGSELSSTESK